MCNLGEKISRKLLSNHFDASQSYLWKAKKIFPHFPWHSINKGPKTENDSLKNTDLAIKTCTNIYYLNVRIHMHRYRVNMNMDK